MQKDTFVSILKAAGLTEEQMRRLHREFESRVPADHQKFLEFLEIPAAEIEQIRAWSKSAN